MGRPQIILTSSNKTASFKVFVVCGWREEAVAGVCLRTYLVHSTYVFLVMYQGYESRKNCKPSCTVEGGRELVNGDFSAGTDFKKCVCVHDGRIVVT